VSGRVSSCLTVAFAVSMMDTMLAPILVTKLYVPLLRPDVVPRLRLVETLNDALRLQHRLSLISAGPGFGKTTLLAEWCHQVQRPTAWLSLDKGDDNPVSFWSHAIVALQGPFPTLGETALNLLRQMTSIAALPIETVLTALINDLDTLSPEQVIILDDYHLITSPALQAGLAFLLDHLPPRAHLVLASRTEPPLPLARWRARHQLTELRAADLSFTADEAAYLLNHVAGLGLAAADITALQSRTEGWIAGLRLAALALQNSPSLKTVDTLAAFSGNHRYIFDYLAEEVFQQQPAGVQAFLLRTSILDQMTASLCEAVTGERGGQADLEALERANLFTTPLDAERHWYRYQALFAEFLRERLRQASAEQMPELHRRASAWYEGQGFVAEAIQHALLAADFDLAARLVEQGGMPILMRGEAATLLKWFDAIPLEVTYARPRLCLLRARTLLFAYEIESADRWAEEASRALSAEAPSAANLPEEREIRGEALAFQAYLARLHGDFARSVDLSQQALALLPAQATLWRCSVGTNLGIIYFMKDDQAAASRFLEDAYRQIKLPDYGNIAVYALHFLGLIQKRQGRLHEAAGRFRQGLEALTEQRRPRMPILSLLIVDLAAVLYEWNDLEAAAQHLTEGLALAEQGGNADALIQGYMTLAEMRQACGDQTGAQEAIEKAVIYNPVKTWDADGVQVKLWIAQGHLEAAAQWAARQNIPSLAVARVLLAQGKKEPGQPYLREAQEMLGDLLEGAKPGPATQLLIKLHTMQALVFQAQGRSHQALKSVGQALALAGAGGYLRLFVDEGAPMRQLLLQAAAAQRQGRSVRFSMDYLGRVLAAFEPSVASQPAGLTRALTVRELQILRLLAAGASNHDIAAELVITVNTTKKHIVNILGKLDAANRTQAVSRARDLGLL
jgi:LuxR family transcriptional regulator, maltose regulon positive regulatory protein